jgi:HK97 family phage prohead protease
MGKNKELRTIAAAELRVATTGNDLKTLKGYAAKYNTRSVKMPHRTKGEYIETIAPGAFRTILKSRPDVRMLVNHDSNLILGRTVSGTLTLSEDSTGLCFYCTLPDTQAARDAYESIKRGDMSQCSFGFSLEPGDDDWSDCLDDDGMKCALRTIRNISELADVSAVAFPAYDDTEVDARKRRSGPCAPANVTADEARVDRVVRLFREING